MVGWLSRGNGWHGFCDANPPYKAKNVGVRRYRLEALQNVIMQVYCCASNPPSNHHSFAINAPCRSDHRCRRIEGTMRSPIKSITVPSITPYEKILTQSRVWRSALNPSSRASFAWRSAFCLCRLTKLQTAMPLT